MAKDLILTTVPGAEMMSFEDALALAVERDCMAAARLEADFLQA